MGDSAILGFPDPSFSPVVVLLGEDEEGNSAHIVLGQVWLHLHAFTSRGQHNITITNSCISKSSKEEFFKSFQEEDVTDTEKSGVISGVLDSIFAESDDHHGVDVSKSDEGAMRENRQLSEDGEEEEEEDVDGHLEALVEEERSSSDEKLGVAKIQSLADIESIKDGKVILRGGTVHETENGEADSQVKTEEPEADNGSGDVDSSEKVEEEVEEGALMTEKGESEKVKSSNLGEDAKEHKVESQNGTEETTEQTLKKESAEEDLNNMQTKKEDSMSERKILEQEEKEETRKADTGETQPETESTSGKESHQKLDMKSGENESESELKTNSEPVSVSESEPAPESEPEPESVPEPETEPEPENEPETELEPYSQPEVELNSDSESKSEHAKVEPSSRSEEDIDSESSTKKEPSESVSRKVNEDVVEEEVQSAMSERDKALQSEDRANVTRTGQALMDAEAVSSQVEVDDNEEENSAKPIGSQSDKGLAENKSKTETEAEEDFSREDDAVDLDFKDEIEEIFEGEEEGLENKDKITIDEKKEETQSDSSEPRDELKSRVESSEDDSKATTLVTKPKPNYVEASGFRRR